MSTQIANKLARDAWAAREFRQFWFRVWQCDGRLDEVDVTTERAIKAFAVAAFGAGAKAQYDRTVGIHDSLLAYQERVARFDREPMSVTSPPPGTVGQRRVD